MLVLGSPFQRYGVAGLLVVLALVLRLTLVGQGYLFLFFYPAVAAAAWWGGVGPGLLAAALSGLLVNLILVPPMGTLNLRPEEIIQAVTFVIAAGVVGWLTGQAREAGAEREQLLARERVARAEADDVRERLTLLTDASSALSGSLDYDATLQRVVRLTVPRLADWCTLNLVDADGRSGGRPPPTRTPPASRCSLRCWPGTRSAPTTSAASRPCCGPASRS